MPGPLPAPSVDWRGSGAAPDLALQARPAKPQEAGGGRGPAAWPRGVAAFRLCFRQVPGSPAPAEFKGERGGGVQGLSLDLALAISKECDLALAISKETLTPRLAFTWLSILAI